MEFVSELGNNDDFIFQCEGKQSCQYFPPQVNIVLKCVHSASSVDEKARWQGLMEKILLKSHE